MAARDFHNLTRREYSKAKCKTATDNSEQPALNRMMMRHTRILIVMAAVSTTPAWGQSDPRHLIPATPPVFSGGHAACDSPASQRLTLPDLIDLALCRNPSTAASWAAVRAAAANVGVNRSSQLPDINASFGPQFSSNTPLHRNLGGTSSNANATATLAIDYLLFDFGGRAAQIDSAQASQRAALAGFADTSQIVALTTINAYNALHAGLASEAASAANVRFLQTSLDNARARQRAGVTTPADALQAQTAYEQAEFILVQARGRTQIARGQLAVAVGLLPQTPLDVEPPPPLASVDLLGRDVGALIDEAMRLRPDLAAAAAQTAAAEANLRSARAATRPSLSASLSSSTRVADQTADGISNVVGISVTVPLFSGFRRTYQIAGAQAALDQSRAQAAVAGQAAALSVWTNYSNLDTQMKSLASARALITSAQASADLVQGRFRAGVGIVNDVLNAAAALATARQQLVTTEFGVRDAQAGLARAIGSLGEASETRKTP